MQFSNSGLNYSPSPGQTDWSIDQSTASNLVLLKTNTDCPSIIIIIISIIIIMLINNIVIVWSFLLILVQLFFLVLFKMKSKAEWLSNLSFHDSNLNAAHAQSIRDREQGRQCTIIWFWPNCNLIFTLAELQLNIYFGWIVTWFLLWSNCNLIFTLAELQLDF